MKNKIVFTDRQSVLDKLIEMKEAKYKSLNRVELIDILIYQYTLNLEEKEDYQLRDLIEFIDEQHSFKFQEKYKCKD